MRPAAPSGVQRGCETRPPSGSAREVRVSAEGGLPQGQGQSSQGQQARGQDLVHHRVNIMERKGIVFLVQNECFILGNDAKWLLYIIFTVHC